MAPSFMLSGAGLSRRAREAGNKNHIIMTVVSPAAVVGRARAASVPRVRSTGSRTPVMDCEPCYSLRTEHWVPPPSQIPCLLHGGKSLLQSPPLLLLPWTLARGLDDLRRRGTWSCCPSRKPSRLLQEGFQTGLGMTSLVCILGQPVPPAWASVPPAAAANLVMG